jgi:hypothetical protein
MVAAALIGFAGCSNPESPETTKETLQGAVEIVGTARVGETLTAVTGGIANGTGTAAYLWKRGTETIAGASGATYTAAAAYEGNTLTVTETYSGNNGSLTSLPTAVVQPEDPTKQTLQGTVLISGTARVGETLTADISGITNGTGTASYLWKRGSEISATGSGSYTLTGGDEKKRITVTVSFSGNNGSLTSLPTAMVQPEGGGGPVTDIPAFNFDSTTTNVNVPNKLLSDTSFSSAKYNSGDQYGLTAHVFPEMISKFVKQDENLISGYGAVAGKYPDSAVFAQLKNAETAMKNGWTLGNDMAGTNAEGIINALFANATTAERKAFEAELSAYQVGTYFEQKERFGGNNKYNPSNDPSRQELEPVPKPLNK